VKLTFPPDYPVADALAFAESRREWLDAMRGKVAARRPAPILPPYTTRAHRLELTPASSTALRVRIGGGVIVVEVPHTLAPTDEAVQQAIRMGVAEACRIEAKGYLPRRVAELAREHGFRAAGVTIRNTVGRWGSCSARDQISLSLHLMSLPDRLIDYVILHELCHTVHKNHGQRFHELLDRVTGGRHDALRRELRGHSPRR